jgi:hypothetical protein
MLLTIYMAKTKESKQQKSHSPLHRVLSFPLWWTLHSISPYAATLKNTSTPPMGNFFRSSMGMVSSLSGSGGGGNEGMGGRFLETNLHEFTLAIV